ncbi:MAG: family oxidoreductase, partial [Tardiphaga sp.]|nr:family oxidoreductase [Tardiphaga sp.]
PGLASEMDPPPDHGEKSYKGSGRLAGRKALITGGDSGMGRAAAIAYAREGADVAINYLPDEEPDAQQVIALIKAAGRTAVAIPGDLRSEAFCQDMVARAVQGLGGLDILVNNAGRQQTRASIMDISSEDFDATMKTNIYAPFWTIKAAMPHLNPGSVIIGTSSEQAMCRSACHLTLDRLPTLTPLASIDVTHTINDLNGRPGSMLGSDSISMKFADGIALFSERNQQHANQFSDFRSRSRGPDCRKRRPTRRYYPRNRSGRYPDSDMSSVCIAFAACSQPVCS